MRTRSLGVAEQASVPQARVVRGRGRGRGRGRAHAVARVPTRAATVEPPVALMEEKVHDYVEPEVPTQVPKAYLFRQLFRIP